MNTEVLVGIIVAVLAIVAVGAWIYTRKRTSHHLRERFGPEYDRALEERGSRTEAEAELRARQKRVEVLNLTPLSAEDSTRYSQLWRTVQTRFVDSPKTAVTEAENLVREVMQKKGYPMSDFEQCAADLSVNHPTVVENYRLAHEVAERNERGSADTEDLRKALVYYRDLFNELLEQPQPEPVGAHH